MDNQGLLREIQGGESKTLELKESLPAKSKKYVKTLVAFANSSGGKLVIGVRDGDREIVGVEDAALAADSIANALSDSCEPMLTPRIRARKRWIPECSSLSKFSLVLPPLIGSRAGKAVEGAYVRVGATTRLADEAALRELALAGARANTMTSRYAPASLSTKMRRRRSATR